MLGVLDQLKNDFSSWLLSSSSTSTPSDQAARLCSVCQAIIQKGFAMVHSEKKDSGSLISHHRTLGSLFKSIKYGCYACSVFWRDVPKPERDTLAYSITWTQPITFVSFHGIETFQSNSLSSTWREIRGQNTINMNISFNSPIVLWPWRKHGSSVFTSLALMPTEELAPHNPCSPTANTTRSEESWSIAIKWVQDCVKNHTKCSKFRSNGNWSPSRVIDVGASADDDPRLVITREEPLDGPYVTLSHCWGLNRFIQLTCDSLCLFTQRIPKSSLSQTFADAMYVTRRLGIRYIWIDSLCIIQDSREDWLHESLLMHMVYTNSMCNIAALGASDGSQGLFHHRPTHSLYPCNIDITRNSADHTVQYQILDVNLWKAAIDNSPLNRRAWVVQERFLAPRVLNFAEQLSWECQELDAAEQYPTGLPRYLSVSAGFKSLDHTPPPSLGLSNQWNSRRSLNLVWSRIVHNYSRSSLTKPEDKVIALAGIIKTLQPLMEDECIAGIWKQSYVTELVWNVNSEQQSVRPEPYRAPSFSWLSIDGAIDSSPELKVENHIEVLEINVVTLTSDSTGPITGGYIRIQGVLKRLQLVRYYGVRWQMVVNGFLLEEFGKNLDRIRYPTVHMDVHQDAFPGELYCMCFYENEPTQGFSTVGGLILEPTGSEKGQFRRVGTFKLFWSGRLYRVLMAEAENIEDMPCEKYDPTSRRHTITIV